MEAYGYAPQEPFAAAPGMASRVPIRKLALLTGLAGLIAQVLTHVGDMGGGAHGGPLGVVVGQAIWNAAQVGLLLTLLCLWQAHRRWWVVGLAVLSLACLPFAIYAISPGAWALSALLLVTCAAAWLDDIPTLEVAIVDAPARGTPTLAKFEFLAFTATLFCSMYNYLVNGGVWPHWPAVYEAIAAVVGFTTDTATALTSMYTLGLEGVRLPPYIGLGKASGNLAAVVFTLIWSVLPAIYVLYFAALAVMAKNSPGTRLQQALCLFCIFHFLFLTDLVDYRYGRGVENPGAIWAHWAEVFAWRIAILLPIYQKLATGQWLRGNGVVGAAMHYGLAAWALWFFLYEVLIYNVFRFVQFALGQEYTPLPRVLFGLPYSEKAGYHGALVLMALVYLFMVIAMPCKRIIADADPRSTRRAIF